MPLANVWSGGDLPVVLPETSSEGPRTDELIRPSVILEVALAGYAEPYRSTKHVVAQTGEKTLLRAKSQSPKLCREKEQPDRHPSCLAVRTAPA